MNDLNLDKVSNDDDFFEALQSTRANLNHIFDSAPKPQHGNSTLKYLPPKHSAAIPQSVTSLAWSSQLAKVVTAFKDSVAMGKVGVALLRNCNDEYKIIVYKSKTNVLATCTLQFNSATATAVYRQHPYLQFYDGAQCYWSLLFDKEDDETEFVKILQTLAVKIIELENKAQASVAPQTDNKLACTTPPLLAASSPAETTGVLEQSKASLVTRIAKMGQKLPTYSMESVTSDDSTDVEVVCTPMVLNSNKPTLAPRSRAKPQASGTVGLYSSCSLPQVQLHETHFMQMMLTENRTQNAEMRMNFNKLENKIEKVLDKMDTVRVRATNAAGPQREDEMLELEEKLLALKKENRQLKQTLETTQRAQPDVDAFLTEFAAQMRELELNSCADWQALGEELVRAAITLQLQLKQMQAKNETLTQQLNEKTDKLTAQTRVLEVKHCKFEALKEEWKLSEASVDKQRHIIHELKEELHQQSLQSVEQQKKARSDTHRLIKEIMNSLYSSLASQLDSLPGDSVNNDQILSIVGKVIKYETMQAMQNK